METSPLNKPDLLAHAAECERALQLATDAEHRDVLARLKAVWLGLAREQCMARDPEMQESIAVLQLLHAHITAAKSTLH